MKIAIIGAMNEEIKFLVSKLEKTNKKQINNFTFFEGYYNKLELVITQSGVGKVAAGMLLTALNGNYSDINLIINVGVAGGVKNKTHVGDVIINEKAFYGDVDLRNAGDYVFGQMSKCPKFFQADEEVVNKIHKYLKNKCLVGSILTTDRFIIDEEDTNKLIETYFNDCNIMCLDMESAAFAQACYFLNKKFISIRAISDVIGENHNHEFDDNLEYACLKSNMFLLELLNIL